MNVSNAVGRLRDDTSTERLAQIWDDEIGIKEIVK